MFVTDTGMRVVGELVMVELAVDFDGGDVDGWGIDVVVDFDGWDVDVFAGCAGVWDGEVSCTTAEIYSAAEVSAKIAPSTVISTPASAAPLNQYVIARGEGAFARFVLDFQPSN